MLKYIHCRYECINDGKSKQKGKFMTKNKSRKMTKSTFAIIIMGIMMVAMLAFGGTFAYFTATATSQSGSFTTGNVKLSSTGSFVVSAKNVMPGDYILGGADNNAENPAAKLTVETTDDAGNYVAIKFTITATDGTDQHNPIDLGDVNLDVTPFTGWQKTDTTGIFIWGSNKSTATAKTNGDITIFENGLTFDADDNWTQGQGNSDNKLMNATVTITLEAKSIQASNITPTDAVTQLIALFA